MERIWQITIIVLVAFVIYLFYQTSTGYMEHMAETDKKIISVADLGGQDGHHVETLFRHLIGNKLVQNADAFRFDRIRPCQEDLTKLKNEGVKCVIGMFRTDDLERIKPFLNENPTFTIISTASTGVIPHQNCIVRTSSPDQRRGCGKHPLSVESPWDQRRGCGKHPLSVESPWDLDNVNLIQLMFKARFGVNKGIIFYDATSEWARVMMGVLSPMSTRVVGYTHFSEIFRNWRNAVMNDNDTDKVIIILNKPTDTKLILQRIPASSIPIVFGDTAGFVDINDIPNASIHLNQYFCLTPGFWSQNDYRLSKKIFGEFVNPEVINIAHAIAIVSDVLSRGTSSECLVKSVINLYGPQGWNIFNTDGDYAVSSRLLSEYKNGSWEPDIIGILYGERYFITRSATWFN